MASIAHPESYYQGASYCSLRVLADVPFASCTSCHVFASVKAKPATLPLLRGMHEGRSGLAPADAGRQA